MFFYEDILKEFQVNKVKYVLVGGIAANLLGAFRNTQDMDILVEMSDDNLSKIVNILKKKGYKVKHPVDPMKIANSQTRTDWINNKNMKAFNFYNEKEFKEVDIIIDSPVSFQQAQKDVIIVKVDGLSIFVISIDNLIKMKKKAARAVDIFDIQQLKELKKLRRKK